LQPLRRRVYPLSEAVAAFRYLQQARQTGKIVVTVARPLPRAEGSYLISGGLGALGLSAAAWLAEQGAGRIVLAGRRGPNAAAQQRLDRLQVTHNCKIHVRTADISDARSVTCLMGCFGQEWPPLRGIIHAAGVLDDGVLTERHWERFETVLRPKALGAWV